MEDGDAGLQKGKITHHKWHYCAMNENCCGVDWGHTILGGGAFALFLRPHRGAFGSLSVTAPREFAIQGEKMLTSGG